MPRLLLVALVIVATLLSSVGSSDANNGRIATLYGWGTLDPAMGDGFQAIGMPSGERLGQTSVGGLTQGGAFALAPDGRHAFLLDREQAAGGAAEWRLSELAVPSLAVVRRTTLPDAINLLGTARVVAVAADSRHVYVETMHVVGPNRIDPVLKVGQPDSVYGIAVYDVARGALTREIRLDPPWCGVADLYALPSGNLAVFCYTSSDVRLIDPSRGVSLGRVGQAGVGSVLSPDGRHIWTIGGGGTVYDVDLTRLVVAHETELGTDGGAFPYVPFQVLHVTADGKQLFVRVAPGDAELRAEGNGTVVWIVDTTTLRRVGTVGLPAPAFYLAPTPDGKMIVATTNNVADRRLFGTRLIDVPSGRVLAYWPGTLIWPQFR